MKQETMKQTQQTQQKQQNKDDVTALVLTALQQERDRRIQAEAQLEAQRGKVLFADAVSSSKESILISEMAVILKQSGVDTGETRLFQWLRDNGYLYRQGCGQNMPSQKSMELGIMELKKQALVSAAGRTSIMKTPKITPKGQFYFMQLLTEQKDAINAREAAKKAEQRKRDNEKRRQCRQTEG